MSRVIIREEEGERGYWRTVDKSTCTNSTNQYYPYCTSRRY